MTVNGDNQVNFDIGDLVRLREDPRIVIGLGLVVEIKTTLEDIPDWLEINEKISAVEHFPCIPHILVMWSLRKTLSNSQKNLWLHPNELMIVTKVFKSQNK